MSSKYPFPDQSDFGYIDLDDAFDDDFDIDFEGILEEFKKDSEKCDHKWIKYRGIIENYEFCEKCDKKREYSK